ncbi:hypothetical protein H2199_008739 [Coniosporium tulheliwenetii]|uniref:Uncharacterized protein n=1 Tax=Coniosporium tulheliwenetii TaxID=3383036 RepID=A0ACC2YIW7_9PEZI|nr:hypothetical protein H2199_008739 [Cladosporium sp. JES 115]
MWKSRYVSSTHSMPAGQGRPPIPPQNVGLTQIPGSSHARPHPSLSGSLMQISPGGHWMPDKVPHRILDGEGLGAVDFVAVTSAVVLHGFGPAGGKTQMPGQSVSGPQVEPSRATQSYPSGQGGRPREPQS